MKCMKYLCIYEGSHLGKTKHITLHSFKNPIARILATHGISGFNITILSR